MSLYACSQCSAVENTAIGAYWVNKIDGKPVLCSECATGKWHGQFPKRFLKDTHYVVQNNGTLAPPGGWSAPTAGESRG